MSQINFSHVPVLKDEVINLLSIKPNGTYIDATVGGAGHSYLIATKLNKAGKLVCLDKDQVAIETSKHRLKEFNNINFVNTDFKNITNAAASVGVEKCSGILADLGVSSYQIDTKERGFSYRFDGPLDMRMDTSASVTASQIVNSYKEKNLADLIYKYGEERYSRQIAAAIVKARPVQTTKQLVEVITSSVPSSYYKTGGHPAMRTFQAIRIEVNKELEGLDTFIKNCVDLLEVGGRLAIITFHSLEDRIVKNTFKELARDCICPPKCPVCICGHKAAVKILTNKPVTATEAELQINTRSSSAKLRVLEKI